MRALKPLVVAGLAIVTAAGPAFGHHSQPAPGGELRFGEVAGNEWWVQVRVTGSAARAVGMVEAMDTGGAWTKLARQSWTPDGTWWAGGFRVEPGHQVRFRASSDGAVTESCWFTHPAGAEQCAAPPPPPPGAFTASFSGVKGNEWWVQATVSASEPLAGVDARVGCTGPWRPMTLQSWGGWTASFHIPFGHVVDMRARSAAGAEARSQGYVWPAATPTEPCPEAQPPPEAGLEAEAFALKTAGGRVASASASGGAAWNLWSNGHIEDRIRTDGGQALAVVARGTPLAGTWPTMVVRVDGTVALTASVSGTSFAAYRTPALPAGEHAVRIAFTNDASSSAEDRNLILDVVRPAAVAVDATVRVDTSRAGGPIDPRIYSFNVASWEPSDFAPPNPTFTGMLRQLDPALLRFPPGHDGQQMYFDPTSTRTSPPAGYTRLLRGDTLDHFVAAARQAGAEPMLEVNLKTGTPEMAAALVRYANVERGHGIRWFELGNEPDLEGRSDPQQEAARFQRFADAMLAVDPSIQLVGGAIMSGANAFGTNGRAPWMDPLADALGTRADALSWHWYPLDSDQAFSGSSAYPSVAHLLQESASDWNPSGMGFAERACAGMEGVRARTGAEHWITELGPDSGARQAPGITDGQASAAWFADVVPRLAECGTDAIFQFAVRQQRESVLVLMTHDRQPTPAWGTYQLLAQHYRGAWLPVTVDGPSTLAAHAARGPDGAASLVLANKGAHAVTVQFQLGDATDAQAWVLEADGPTSTAARVNGLPLDRDLVLAGFPAREHPAGAPITLPPYGVAVVRSGG